MVQPLQQQPRPPALCPHCGSLLARTWTAGGQRPFRPGDFAVCRSCAGPLVLDGGLRPAAPTDAELVELCAHFPEVATELACAVRFVLAELAERGPLEQPPEGHA